MRLSFRSKLLVLFLTLSVVPLVIVAFILSNTVTSQIKENLAKAFIVNVNNREKIINYYLEGNKAWIKSIAAQDILLAEVEKHAAKQPIAENKVFATLVSLQRENQFINKVYIADNQGTIISSTTSDDEGKNISDSELELNLDMRKPHYTKLRNTSESKRILTLATPFIQRSNNQIVGNLIIEYQASVIKSLIDGSIYESKSLNEQSNVSIGNTYIIDEEGYILTSITGTSIEKNTATNPTPSCQTNTMPTTGNWKNNKGNDVYGAINCSTVDSLKLIYIVDEEYDTAFASSQNIRNTIIIITLSMSLLLSIFIVKIASSVTSPLKKLTQGVQAIGKGDFNTKLCISTGDEIEKLANSFNEMTSQISTYINDLKNQELQVKEINSQLEKEKENISAERNKLEVIASGISDAIIAIDLNRVILSCNKSAENILGLAKEAIIGKQISEILEVENESGRVDESIFCPIRTDDFEGVIYNEDNVTLKPVSAKPMSVHILTGKIKEGVSINLGCILTIHDKSKESELEDMKLDFVSMAAHELRTPITSIRGYTNLLQDEMGEIDSEQIKEWQVLLQRIAVSSEQLLALVENLLNITKIEKGILSLACKEQNWKDCVDEVVDVFKDRAKSKDITLTVKEIDNTLIASVDKIRINEVLSNLVSNAITYTHEGGSVTVETHASTDGNWIETSVADNGKGIPKSAQGHLFQKFFRVTGPLEEGSKGNGLGLYISKSIVEMHGGKIWVESDEGQGAKFTYTIPRTKK